MQPLSEPAKKRIKWMELMMEFIPDLYGKIAAEKEKRRKSYLKILDHIRKIDPVKKVKGRSAALQIKQSNNAHYSEAEAEAENYIIFDRKWIALKETEKQCQKIEDDVSFHYKPETLTKSKINEMATVIFAFEFCKTELSGVHELEEVRKRLEGYFDDGGLNAKKGTLLTSEVRNKLQSGELVTSKEKEEIVEQVAKANQIGLS